MKTREKQKDSDRAKRSGGPKLYSEMEQLLKKRVLKLRVANISGTGHSKMFAMESKWNPEALNIHDLSLLEDFRVTQNHLTCGAGLRLGEIRDLLKPYAKRLRGTPEADTISL